MEDVSWWRRQLQVRDGFAARVALWGLWTVALVVLAATQTTVLDELAAGWGHPAERALLAVAFWTLTALLAEETWRAARAGWRRVRRMG